MADHEHHSAKSEVVVHNASSQRLEMDVDGQLSVLEYTFKNHRLFLTHPEVPPGSSEPGPGYKPPKFTQEDFEVALKKASRKIAPKRT